MYTPKAHQPYFLESDLNRWERDGLGGSSSGSSSASGSLPGRREEVVEWEGWGGGTGAEKGRRERDGEEEEEVLERGRRERPAVGVRREVNDRSRGNEMGEARVKGRAEVEGRKEAKTERDILIRVRSVDVQVGGWVEVREEGGRERERELGSARKRKTTRGPLPLPAGRESTLGDRTAISCVL